MSNEKLADISEKMLDAIFLIETAKDACIANDFCSVECVLNYSLNIIHNIHDEIELMY